MNATRKGPTLRVSAGLAGYVALAAASCAEQHLSERSREAAVAVDPVSDASFSAANGEGPSEGAGQEPAPPPARIPDSLDAARCDDRGIDYVIDDLILDGAFVPREPCAIRFQKPRFKDFNPWRLAVSVDQITITPDFAAADGAGDYSIDGDVIRITGPMCERLQSDEGRLQSDAGRLHAIGLRYGACRIWE